MCRTKRSSECIEKFLQNKMIYNKKIQFILKNAKNLVLIIWIVSIYIFFYFLKIWKKIL